ncbi:MAG: hypothetical protein K1X57_04825 [Gemmataceae bacterium]|nr:hypothetical protein [Gemmataceae bacterium]
MHAASDDVGLIRRMWAGWSWFWFTPADPTPLCFMRIVVGLLTLYVHVAYTFDLEAFFGPKGWCDQTESNLTRRELPHLRVRWDWTEENYYFRMPLDKRQRNLVRDLMFNILKSPEPDRVLMFMHSLGLAGNERDELLRYLRDMPTDKAERDASLQALLDEKLPEEEKSLLPKFFLRQTTLESRQSFAAEAKRFQDLLPAGKDDRRILVQLLLDTSPIDWQAFQDFVRNLQGMSPAERDEFMAYFMTWAIPKSVTHTVGMSQFSPWFHVTDLRILWLLHGLHILAIIAFLVGWQTRVSNVLTWFVGLAYIHRAQPYLFGQDTMMNLAHFYLMFSPCGARWSVDRWLERKRAQERGEQAPPVRPSISAGFVIRVFQVQYCFMYMSAGLSKLKGPSWWNGTALFGCLNNPEFSPMHMSLYRDFVRWMCEHRIAFELFNTGVVVFTLLLEIAFPFVVWTRLRPVVVACAILLHMGIAILMGLNIFSMYMFALLLAWFPPATINNVFGWDDACVEQS